MYETLLMPTPQGTIDYGQSLASGITVSNGDSTYTVHLKQWKWSNGQPVTAGDILYDWQLIKAASQPKAPFPYCLANIGGIPNDVKSITAPTRYTLVVNTTKPVNPTWFITSGLSSFTPVPQVWHKYANMGKELSWIQSIANAPLNPIYKVVDGPYDVSGYKTNQYYEFSINPHYSGPKKPTIEHVFYYEETSDAAAFAQLRKQTVDIAEVPLGISDSEWRPAHQLTGYKLDKLGQMTTWFLVPNMAADAAQGMGPLFQQLYIRQALQYGINEQGIVQAVFHGAGFVTDGPIASYPHNSFYDYSLKHPYSFDPARGKQILEAHGWTEQNGVMTKAGKRLAFTILYAAGNVTNQDELEIIKADWAQEGVQATLKALGGSTFGNIEYSEPTKWAMAMNEWIYYPDYDPTGEALFLPGGGDNTGAYNDPRMTQLINATLSPATAQQTEQRLHAYQAYASQQVPWLFLPVPDLLFAVKNDVHGFKAGYDPFLTYSWDNWLSFSK